MRRCWSVPMLMIFVTVVSTLLAIGTPNAAAEDGVMDLSRATFSLRETMILDGPWAFYWDRLLNPEDMAPPRPEPDGYHVLPQYWTRHDSGDYSSIGSATYALDVLVPAHVDSVSLRVPEIYTSYVLWVNKQLLGGHGSLVGESPRYLSPRIYGLQRPEALGGAEAPWELQILLQVSNDYHYFAGVARRFSIGATGAIHAQRLRQVVLDVFILTLLVAASAYHLVQYHYRRRRPEFLYFALMGLPAILRRLLSNEVLLMEFLPGLPYIVGSRMLSLAIPGFVFFFVSYITAMGQVSLPRWLTNVAKTVSVLYAVAVAIMPVHWYAFWFQPYLILLFLLMLVAIPRFLKAFANSLEARFIVMGGLAVFAGGLRDALVYHQVIHGPFIMDLGILVFMALQTISLGMRETKLQREVHELHAQLQENLREIQSTRSAFLSAQIKPHFLFNALNTIAYLAHADSEKAVELISNLSAFLRQTFDFETFPDTVPLHSELRMLQAYVNVEKSRYGDELEVDIRCEIGDTSVELPPFSIQPLVENAIVHGVRQSEDVGCVKVVIERRADRTVVTVADNGVGVPQTELAGLLQNGESRGIGLQNVHTRLLMQYGRGLDITSTEGEGTTVTFVVPDDPMGLDRI